MISLLKLGHKNIFLAPVSFAGFWLVFAGQLVWQQNAGLTWRTWVIWGLCYCLILTYNITPMEIDLKASLKLDDIL